MFSDFEMEQNVGAISLCLFFRFSTLLWNGDLNKQLPFMFLIFVLDTQ